MNSGFFTLEQTKKFNIFQSAGALGSAPESTQSPSYFTRESPAQRPRVQVQFTCESPWRMSLFESHPKFRFEKYTGLDSLSGSTAGTKKLTHS